MKRLFLLIILIAITTSCSNHSGRSYALSSFLKDRNATRGYLERSFMVVPEGASLTKLSEKQDTFGANWPGDSHIRNVVKRQPWSGRSHYHFTLDLSEALLSSHEQGNSNTMTAVQLLNHYFAGLSNLGFRNEGSAHVLSSHPIQYASNKWFKEHRNNILIIAGVYVDIEDKTALVVVDISEVY